jgi:S-DNA-T family DNA segregation ATPase FtsK/SpoIIIE
VSLVEIIYLFVALAVLVIACRYGLGPFLIWAAVRRDADLARSCWQAAAIRRRWRHLARALSLVLADKGHQGPLGSSPAAAPGRVTYRCPRLHVRPDSYGVTATLRTVAGVGLTEVEKHAQHLADAWGCVRVAVTQLRPGQVRIRAVRRDPLTIPTEYQPDCTALAVPDDLDRVYLGLDEYGDPVEIRLSGVSGITVAGLPGYGKTSLIMGLIARLAPSPAVQFIIFDGKVDDPAVEGDYVDVADRCAVMIGDDLQAAHDVLTRLSELRRARSRSIRAILGAVNFWHVPPTAAWPLIVLVIDECQTFYRQVKATPKSPAAERNVLADQCAQLTEDLIKKGRSVGLLVVVASQKVTGDAVPTAIRDVCSASLSFAQRTVEAAVAALGDGVRSDPSSPVGLLDESYVGVAALAAEGRPGLSRVRTPFTSSATAAAVTGATALLCGRRGELPAVPAPVMIGTADDDD